MGGAVPADASRSVVSPPLLPGQDTRSAQAEVQCWASLALVTLCGGAGVTSALGSAMAPMLDPLSPFQDVTFLLDSGR